MEEKPAADVAIDVSGEMAVPPADAKGQFAGLLQMPAQLPNLKEWVWSRRQTIRPWLQFFQTANFKVPSNPARLSRRVMRNIEYFSSNYVFVFLGLIAYCLLTSPLLLIAIGVSLYVGYKLSQRQQKLKIFGRELSLAQQYTLVVACSIPMMYVAGAGAALFWVLGASMFVITLHAAFYNIDALVADDDSFGLIQDV